jgi:hypothetical protein
MLCNGYDQVLELRDGDSLNLSDARGTTLRVTRGTLWVTQEHDTRDVVLRAGDVWTVERQGLTIIEAQRASTVCLVGEAAQAAHARPRRTRLGERVSAWFETLGAARLGRRWIPYL